MVSLGRRLPDLTLRCLDRKLIKFKASKRNNRRDLRLPSSGSPRGDPCRLDGIRQIIEHNQSIGK